MPTSQNVAGCGTSTAATPAPPGKHPNPSTVPANPLHHTQEGADVGLRQRLHGATPEARAGRPNQPAKRGADPSASECHRAPETLRPEAHPAASRGRVAQIGGTESAAGMGGIMRATRWGEGGFQGAAQRSRPEGAPGRMLAAADNDEADVDRAATGDGTLVNRRKCGAHLPETINAPSVIYCLDRGMDDQCRRHRGSGGPDGIAPARAPTPPDLRFSASGG